MLDSLQDQVAIEVARQRLEIRHDLHLFCRVSFEGRSEVLADLQKRPPDFVDERQARVGDSNVVEYMCR
jgi:hypothetical protein